MYVNSSCCLCSVLSHHMYLKRVFDVVLLKFMSQISKSIQRNHIFTDVKEQQFWFKKNLQIKIVIKYNTPWLPTCHGRFTAPQRESIVVRVGRGYTMWFSVAAIFILPFYYNSFCCLPAFLQLLPECHPLVNLLISVNRK